MEAHGCRGVVKDTGCKYNLGRVGTADNDAGHDCNANVLLDGERTGIEGPDVAESFEAPGRKDGGEGTTTW